MIVTVQWEVEKDDHDRKRRREQEDASGGGDKRCDTSPHPIEDEKIQSIPQVSSQWRSLMVD